MDDETSDCVYYSMGNSHTSHAGLGSHKALPQDPRYLVHCVELGNLTPDSTYSFRLKPEGKCYSFHTMPAQLNRPVRFIAGGDMYHETLAMLRETNQQAAKTNPDFALVGGDIAYAAGKKPHSKEDIARWIEWIQSWYEDMVTDEGCLIPFLPVIGNHDVNGAFGQTPKEATTFYTLFATPGDQGYNVIDFNNYLSIILLDSGHTHPIEGEQTKWLAQTLENRSAIPNKFALYHVTAFPSARKFIDVYPIKIRKHWVPIFEHFGLTAAFENHDHAYKRTPPIRNNKAVDADGVVYIGDGGWGAKPRKPHSDKKTWYLAKTARARNFVLVTINPDGHRQLDAYDEKGNQIDHASF